MVTMIRPTLPRPVTTDLTSYGRLIRSVLVTAFALSAAHTVYSWAVGIGDPRFTVDTPVAWAFYAVGFASAYVAARDPRWARWVLAAYLSVLLYVAVFWYPTTFEPRQQTTFGWFENDVYTGLLMIALYLDVLHLRGRSITPAS